MRCTAIGAGIGLLASAATAQPTGQFQPFPQGEPATASLISLESALVPGEITHLALRFEIRDHWHIYWEGMNDTGLSPAIALDLPDGYEALPTRWPAPTRYIVGNNDLLDHVLEGEVLAVIPVRTPEDAPIGSSTRIGLKADWLVCEEACLPGDANLSIELPVASSFEPTASAAAFRRAWPRMPVPLVGDGSSLGISLVWEDDQTLTVRTENPGRIEFYPHATGTAVADRFADAVSDSGRLRLRFEAEGPARGVLRIERTETDRRPALIAIDLAPGATSNPTPSPAIGWRPWMKSVDGPHPQGGKAGTPSEEDTSPDGRGG